MRGVPFLALALAGCSLVNDPGAHMGGAPTVDAGGGEPDAAVDSGPSVDDAGPADAGPTDAGPPPPIAAADLCTELVAAMCEMRRDCCATTTESFDECRANLNPGCVNGFGDFANDGRTGYDPDVAAEVVAELRSFIASCDVDVVDFLADRDGLTRFYTGTFPARTGCNAATAEFYACDGELVCRGPLFFWTCQPPAAADEACRADTGCVDRHFCDETRGTAGGTGLCTPRLADGQACERNAQCASLLCDGARCQTRTPDLFCGNPFMDG